MTKLLIRDIFYLGIISLKEIHKFETRLITTKDVRKCHKKCLIARSTFLEQQEDNDH